MRVTRDESGFTLIELLVATMIAGFVLAAAFTMVTRAEFTQKDVADRVDAQQRGRLAIDSIAARLRAASCLADATPPIVAASSDSITFYADYDGDTLFDPEQWRLYAVRDASGKLTAIKQDRWAGLTPPVAGTTSPTSSRTLIGGISDLVDGGVKQPLFSYYAYTAPTDETTTQLATGTVAAANLQRIVQIDVDFDALPLAKNLHARPDAWEQTSVYARTVRRDAAVPAFDCSP